MDNTTKVDPTVITHAARDALTVQRVFGDAYERNGALVIPVAKLWGGTASGWGSGSGSGGLGPLPHRGTDDEASRLSEGSGEGAGGGGGFGVRVKPLGVYVVDERGTRWRPTVDLNRVILGGQVVAVIVATVAGWTLGRWRRR